MRTITRLPDGCLRIRVTIERGRVGGVPAIHVDGTSTPGTEDAHRHLVSELALGRSWAKRIATGGVASCTDLAKETGRDVSQMFRSVALAFLAPKVVEAVLAKRIAETSQTRFFDLAALPWPEQCKALGID